MEQVPTWVEAFSMRTLPDRCILDTLDSGRPPIIFEDVDLSAVFRAAMRYKAALYIPAIDWRMRRRNGVLRPRLETSVIPAMGACFALLDALAEAFGHDTNPFDVCVVGPSLKVDGILKLKDSSQPIYHPLMQFVKRPEDKKLKGYDPQDFDGYDPQNAIELIDLGLFQMGYLANPINEEDAYVSSVLVWPERGVLIFRGAKYTGLNEQCCRWVSVLKRARGKIVSRREAAGIDNLLLGFRPKRLLKQLPAPLAACIKTDTRGSRLEL